MSDVLNAIKEKYSEEVGFSFTFFEVLTFLVYLVVSYVLLFEGQGGVWGVVLTKSVDDILLADASVVVKARMADFLVAAVLTYSTIFAHKKISSASYVYLATLKDMEEYVNRLKAKYSEQNFGGQAMRLYIANTAKEQKQIYLKELMSTKGFGLIALTVAFSSLLGLLTPNAVDFLVLIGGLGTFLLMQWSVFTGYTSRVVPMLVLERVARDENVNFGDGLQ